MFCKNCGREINDSKFCMYCGTKQESNIVVMPASENTIRDNTEKSREEKQVDHNSRKNIKGILFACLLIVILLLIGMGLLWIAGRSKSSVFLKLLEQGKVEEAKEYYDDNLAGDAPETSKAYEASKKEIDNIVSEYYDNAILYDDAIDKLNIYSDFYTENVKEAKEKGANVYAEASPHHFTLTEEAVLKYGTLARMNPPLRTEEDRQRIIKGLQEGTIEIIATDHAPHSKEEKDKPLDQAPSGITGIETSLALGVTELVEKGYLSMMQLLEKMTINPAKLYNMEQGRLQEGKPADVVLFDPEEEWEVKEYKSKATNSPFTGWKLKGKVKYTICDGKIIEL